MRKLTAIVAAVTLVMAVSPTSLAVLSARGEMGNISGMATSASLSPLAGAVVQLTRTVNFVTTVVGSTRADDRTGAFMFNDIAPGTYTLNLMGPVTANGVVSTGIIGTSSVTVAAGATATTMITGTTSALAGGLAKKGGGGWSTTKTVILAAVIIGGIVVIVETRGEASPSR